MIIREKYDNKIIVLRYPSLSATYVAKLVAKLRQQISYLLLFTTFHYSSLSSKLYCNTL